VFTGISENNGDGKLRSTGTTQILLETKLRDVEGEGSVNECTEQWWFKWFASSNLSLEDEQRPGRPRMWDNEATKEASEQQPSTSTRR
jgi:hypothetical protein